MNSVLNLAMMRCGVLGRHKDPYTGADSQAANPQAAIVGRSGNSANGSVLVQRIMASLHPSVNSNYCIDYSVCCMNTPQSTRRAVVTPDGAVFRDFGTSAAPQLLHRRRPPRELDRSQ